MTITVTGVNDDPTISDVSDQSTAEDVATSAIAVTVGDAEDAGSLLMTGSSSDTTLVPNANIVFGGSGTNRTVTVTPAADQSGTATITLTVTDAAGATASDTFVLTVTPVTDAVQVTNATTTEDTQTTSGLVVTPNAVDGAAVTHFKVTAVANGTLYQSNGTTAIAENTFITAADGAAGLRFTPAANLNSPSSTFSFTVQGATSGTGDDLGPGTTHRHHCHRRQ